MSKAQTEAVTRAVADVVGEHLRGIAVALRSHSERLAALEGRQLSYEGTWREDTEYSKGAMVTHAGSIWHCETTCQGDLPGRSNSWKLAVKSGGR